MALLPTAYCTVAEADGINSSTDWLTLNDTEKQTALDWGRVYLDSNYSCSTAIDTTTPQDEAKLANALLGDKYAQGILFNHQDHLLTYGQNGKTVKAGSVSSSTTYNSSLIMQLGSDPFPDVSAAIASLCSPTNVLGCIKNADLLRS